MTHIKYRVVGNVISLEFSPPVDGAAQSRLRLRSAFESIEEANRELKENLKGFRQNMGELREAVDRMGAGMTDYCSELDDAEQNAKKAQKHTADSAEVIDKL